eukprot:364189-Chlamydomonas_euryale.AAC.15
MAGSRLRWCLACGCSRAEGGWLLRRADAPDMQVIKRWFVRTCGLRGYQSFGERMKSCDARQGRSRTCGTAPTTAVTRSRRAFSTPAVSAERGASGTATDGHLGDVDSGPAHAPANLMHVHLAPLKQRQ